MFDFIIMFSFIAFLCVFLVLFCYICILWIDKKFNIKKNYAIKNIEKTKPLEQIIKIEVEGAKLSKISNEEDTNKKKEVKLDNFVPDLHEFLAEDKLEVETSFKKQRIGKIK